MNISSIKLKWPGRDLYYKIFEKSSAYLSLLIFFVKTWTESGIIRGRNEARFPIPGHLVHPMPDNDITFRGFSVGISPIIYRHKVEWPYPVVISAHGSKRRPRDHLWNGTECSNFSLVLYTFVAPSLVGVSLERGQFLSNQTSSSNWRTRQYRDAPWKIIQENNRVEISS